MLCRRFHYDGGSHCSRCDLFLRVSRQILSFLACYVRALADCYHLLVDCFQRPRLLMLFIRLLVCGIVFEGFIRDSFSRF